jgi:hypothetical protein
MSGEEDKERHFLKRWSDRKTVERDLTLSDQVKISEQSETIVPAEFDDLEDQDVLVPDDLPDIDTLDKDSDFSLFMRKGTPEHLKKLALKKLFHSDPAFSVLDGLNDYDEDYSMIGMVAEVVSTRYKPGRGMVDPDEEALSKEQVEGSSDNTQDDSDPKDSHVPEKLSDYEAEQEPLEDFIEEEEIADLEDNEIDEEPIS